MIVVRLKAARQIYRGEGISKNLTKTKKFENNAFLLVASVLLLWSRHHALAGDEMVLKKKKKESLPLH